VIQIPEQIKLFDKISLEPGVAVSSNTNETIISGPLVVTKEFIKTNKKQIVSVLISLLGFTLSSAIGYLLFNWLMKNFDPTNADKRSAQTRAEKILKEIGVNNIDLNEYELCIASNIILPKSLDISWQDIGGLEHIINDLRETVIYPLRNFESDLNTTPVKQQQQQQQEQEQANNIITKRSKLIQPPKGVLLFGPPGNAKTMIAKALAKESGARFINLQVSTLFDKWFGESQKRTEAVFSLATKVQPVIIFIDEIDSFLRSRRMDDHECTSTMKTQFMTLWDGLSTMKKNRVLIIGATNRPEDVDPAILRRMPQMFYIGLPNEMQRKKILNVILKDENLADDVDLDVIASKTDEFSGSDLHEVSSSNNNESTTRIRNCDFEVAFDKMAVKSLANLKSRFDFQTKHTF